MVFAQFQGFVPLPQAGEVGGKLSYVFGVLGFLFSMKLIIFFDEDFISIGGRSSVMFEGVRTYAKPFQQRSDTDPPL